MSISSTLLAMTLLGGVYDKAYVKGNHSGKTGVKQLHFGLTDEQKQKIADLTDGKIDFRNHFVTTNLYNKIIFDPSIEFHSSKTTPPMIVTEFDPKQKDGWWQQAHKVDEAWKLATGKGVTIADCDAGYHTEEADIKGNLILEHAKDLADKENPTKINDGNFVTHGTSVAAIMVGLLDGTGINGMAYESKLVPLQNYNYDYMLDDMDKEEATAACILEALKIPEVKVIVLENQTHGSSETFSGTRDAVRLALKANVTIVSAGGNSSNELTAEAADDTGSIIVGAINKNGKTETFSNYGSRVSIAAYGSDLLTLSGPNGKLGKFGGTSGATPQVAATVAMMLEVNPDLTPEQIKQILIETRTTTEENKKVGGMINVVAAITKAKDLKTTPAVEAEAFREELVSILK